MDYASKSAQELRDMVRERKLASNGSVGLTSWVVNATKPQLTAALQANDSGTVLDSMPSGTTQSDAIAVITRALESLTNANASSVDKATVRRIAADEARKIALPTRTLVSVAQDAPAIDVGMTHECFAKVLKLVQNGYAVYLLGPPGTGKTHIAAQVAQALGLAFEADSLANDTPEYRIVGFRNMAGEFQATGFHRVVKDGGLYLADEADKGPGSIAGLYNMTLSNGHGSFACGLVEKNANARFMFTGNTAGFGATPQYPDRNVLPADFRNRLVYVYIGVDETLERALALARNPKADAWVSFVQSTRARVNAAGLPMAITPRASINGAGLLALGMTRDEVEQAVIWQGAPESMVERAKAVQS